MLFMQGKIYMLYAERLNINIGDMVKVTKDCVYGIKFERGIIGKFVSTTAAGNAEVVIINEKKYGNSAYCIPFSWSET